MLSMIQIKTLIDPLTIKIIGIPGSIGQSLIYTDPYIQRITVNVIKNVSDYTYYYANDLNEVCDKKGDNSCDYLMRKHN